MSNTELTGVALAAALAEEIYRRDVHDIRIDVVNDLKVSAVSLTGANLPGLTRADGYFYSNRGFVGRVVEKGVGNDKVIYVVFRGTDSAEGFGAGVRKGAEAFTPFLDHAKANPEDATLNPFLAQDSTRKSDVGDWVYNIASGLGTGFETQVDDALALTRAAISYANNQKSRVVVVGQSLGGGLAALVSAVEGIKGYAIAPSPTFHQLRYTAAREAASEVLGINLPGALYWLSEAAQRAYIQRVTGSSEKADQFFQKSEDLYQTYLSNVGSGLLEIHTIVGEASLSGARLAHSGTPCPIKTCEERHEFRHGLATLTVLDGMPGATEVRVGWRRRAK